MAKRGKGQPVDDGADAFPGGPATDPDVLGLGVEVRRTPAGHGVIVPRSVGKLSGEAEEVAAVLQDISMHRAQLATELDSAVLEARDLGMSWAAIGWCVGTTGDAARQRWSA